MRRWVIVGGGTAGCVVAGALAGDGNCAVTLVEAGSGDGRRLPVASTLADLAVPGAIWSGADVLGPAGPAGRYLQGRGPGGSSRVNGAIVADPVAARAAGLPIEQVTIDELGPVDRALLDADGRADRIHLVRQAGRPTSVAEVFLAGPTRARLDRREALVDRVLVERERAVGVELVGGEVLPADGVVLTAGVLGTPAVLARSGLGIGRPGFGDLVDHPAVVFDLTLRPGTASDPAALVTGVAVRTAGLELLALNHVGDASGRGALLVGAPGAPRRGWIDLDRVADPGRLPAVRFAPLDISAAALFDDATALARRLLATSAFGAVVESFALADPAVAGGYYHAVGSCPVGSVVDEYGAVIGVAGLFVADASALAPARAGPLVQVVAAAWRLAVRWAATEAPPA
jgi:choline dehydrogenase